MTDFPYPGDDPADLASASSTFDANVTNMHTLISAVNDAESNIKGSWKGETATAASGDIAKINKVLTLTVTDFKTSKTALDTLHDALVPIRHQVDELRRQLATAQRTLQGEQEQYGRAGRFGEANDMTPAEVTQYRNTIAGQETKTQGDITGLNNDYTALVRKANTATATCSDALKATISGSTYDPNTSGIKGTNLDDILALDGLSLLHRYDAGQDATKAAADTKKLLTLQPGSPEAVKLAHELAGLLHKYPDGDPDFSVPYLKQVGQDDLLKLTVYVAGLQDTGGDGKALGQDIGEIQRDLGTDLAAATHLLGKPNPNGTQQLDQAWVDTLLKDGGKGYRTSVGGYTYDIKGFQSLGILMRTGDYGSTFLSESGDALMDYEKSYKGDDLQSNTWYDLGAGVTPNLRLWWGAGDGPKVERGLDPFNGWVAGMDNSSEAKQVLYDDVTPGSNSYNNHGLLNYLLDHRDWSLRDVNPDQSIMGHYDSGETRPGLIDLGDMLDRKIGVGALDPQSKAIFQSMVHDLGNSSDDNNGERIKADGGFTGNDWIPPELRPYLGDVTARNIDSVHQIMADSSFDPGNSKTDNVQNDYTRFLSDLGKDPTAGGSVYNAEKVWTQQLLSDPNHFHQADVDALSRVTGLLSHGHAAHDTGVQQAADTEHNANVELIKSAVEAGTGAVEIPGGPVVGAGVDFIKGQFLDSIFGGMEQDHSADVNASNSNYSAYMAETTKQAVLTAAYQGIPPDVLNSVHAPTVDGHPVSYAQLTDGQRHDIQNALEDKYGNRYDANFGSGSSAESTTQLMEAYAQSIGVK